MQQPAHLVGVGPLADGAKHPSLELVVHLVGCVLERGDLRRETFVVEQDRRVREPDGHLGRVLQLDEQVDGSIEAGERLLGRLAQVPARRAGQLADQVDALLRALEEQHVAGGEDLVATGAEDPMHVAPDRDHPHPGLGRQPELPERLALELVVLSEADAGDHLLGVPQIVP